MRSLTRYFFKILIEVTLYGLMIFILGSMLIRCSSVPASIQTERYTQEVKELKEEIATLPEPVKIRITKTLDNSIELMNQKDSQIASLTEKNKELSVKADKWDRLIFWIWTIVASVLVFLIAWFVWKNRLLLFRLAGLPIPPWAN